MDIKIRELEFYDLNYLYHLFLDDELCEMADKVKITDQTKFIERYARYFDNRRKNVFVFTVLVNEAVAGTIDFLYDTQNNKIEFGIVIGREFWGHGVATNALKLLFNHAFTVLRVHSIRCEVYPENTRSKKLMEKLGMTLEGLKRDCDYRNGKYKSLLQYSILESEFY